MIKKEEGARVLVQINDQQSVVSLDEDELMKKQAEGEDIMILSLMRQTERLSFRNMTPSKM